MKKIFLLACLSGIVFACSNQKEKINQEELDFYSDSIQINQDLPKVNFYQYADSSAFPDAILELYTPLGNQIFKPGKVPFEFNIKNYSFESSDKLEFKLFNILNGDDPVGFYSPIFQRDLAQGSYRVVAYLVDDEGLSLKSFGNYVYRDFQVGDSRPFPYSAEPYLALNFPRSEQVFEVGNVVIIDFLVIEGDMELDGLKVMIEVNDFNYSTKEMLPVRIENLPAGSYRIKIRLTRIDGKELEGPFSSVSKSIIVR
jgi:hypothetical protein